MNNSSEQHGQNGDEIIVANKTSPTMTPIFQSAERFKNVDIVNANEDHLDAIIRDFRRIRI